jgi:hypothetical protein
MATQDWLKSAFSSGYRSGNILSWVPGRVRFDAERISGGSYRRVFLKAVQPYITETSTVLELGPGSGDWTRAILSRVVRGRVITVDYQDVRPWLKPERYGDRLECLQVQDNSFDSIEDGAIDFFWSLGVLCHHSTKDIREIFANARKKMRPSAYACHQYGDWNKLDQFGWQRGRIPVEFRDKSDDEIWWPRNSEQRMREIAEETGWTVLSGDLGLLKRDGLILLRA